METREALIALNLIPGLGSVTIHRLLAAFESPEQIFRASPVALKEILGRFGTEEVIGRILSGDSGTELSAELRRTERAGVQMTTLLDESYPGLLKSIPDPPPILYVKGTLLEEDEAAVAVVGTRRATPYGLNAARHFGRALAQCGITVVSGLAEGIDGAAHEGALEAKGRTLAVLGHGLNFLFPLRHRKLADRITESGALVSEFPMAAPGLKENFPRRNRVIAGLSLGVLVAEAPLKSGALITAREALEQGRDVFAVPGPISSDRSRGTHQLLKEGAKLVEDVRDILQELAPALQERLIRWTGHGACRGSPRLWAPPPGVDPPTAGHPRATRGLLSERCVEGLSQEERKVYEAVPTGTGSTAESISRRAVLNPGRLLSVLTELEMRGLVRQIPGQGYSRSS